MFSGGMKGVHLPLRQIYFNDLLNAIPPELDRHAYENIFQAELTLEVS